MDWVTWGGGEGGGGRGRGGGWRGRGGEEIGPISIRNGFRGYLIVCSIAEVCNDVPSSVPDKGQCTYYDDYL